LGYLLQHSGDKAVLVLAHYVQRPVRHHQLPRPKGTALRDSLRFLSRRHCHEVLTLPFLMWQMLDIIDSSSKDDSHYLYFCSNKACGMKYAKNSNPHCSSSSSKS
jgi:hypothetical protein